jgi:hypothetical protein
MSAPPSEGRFMRCYKGVLTDEGVECQAFRSEDNELFTLIGNLEGYGVGDQVVVCGTIAEISPCMQGTTLVISYIGKKLPKALKQSTKKPSKSSP